MTKARTLATFDTTNINPANLDATGTIPSALLAGIGGGTILGIARATNQAAELMASSTFNSTGIYLTYTPTSATSKLLVMASSPQGYSNGTITLTAAIYMGTGGEGSGSAIQTCLLEGQTAGNNRSPLSMTAYVPASSVTTSATTFTVMHKNSNNASLVGWYESLPNSLPELIVMEIAA